MILTQYASSLAEVYAAAKVAAWKHDYESECYLNNYIGEKKPKLPSGRNTPVLWFRGHEKSWWNLEPSLLRERFSATSFEPAEKWSPNYEQSKLQESYRLQYISARAYHIISDKPANNIEWQEILQHYWVSTRLMDWTENLNIALLFALEPFIANPEDDTFKVKRIEAEPTIWIFNPALSNAKLYDIISNDEDAICDAVRVFFGGAEQNEDKVIKTAREIRNYLHSNRDSIFDAHEFRGSNLVSLSRLAELRASAGANLLQMLKTAEFNPFFFLLLRFYNDGIKLFRELPPLAMIHPYHSQRIAAQKGAFTLFTFPKSDNGNEKITPMNLYPGWDNCLCKIRLTDPQAISDELVRIGFSREDIYPELEVFGKEAERRQIGR